MLTGDEPLVVTDMVDYMHMALYAFFIEVAFCQVLAFAVPVYGAICQVSDCSEKGTC